MPTNSQLPQPVGPAWQGGAGWEPCPGEGKLSPESAHYRQTPGVRPAPSGEREGLPRLQEPASKIAGTRTIRGAVQPGEGEERPSPGTPRSRLQEVQDSLRPALVGVTRPKEAHLFPTLKNLVPMVTELAGRAGGGGGEAGCQGALGRGGDAGEGGLLQGRLEPARGGKMAAAAAARRCRPPACPRRTPPCRSRPAPRLPDAGGAEAGRVSDLSRGTAWTLHLTALPNASSGWEGPAAALWNVRERSRGQG